eukprot:6492091-Amphidinium_carterae.2
MWHSAPSQLSDATFSHVGLPVADCAVPMEKNVRLNSAGMNVITPLPDVVWTPEITQTHQTGEASITRPRTRAVENAWAIGGMKQPLLSIEKLRSNHRLVGSQVLALLARLLVQDTKLRCACLRAIGHPSASGPDEVQLSLVRAKLAGLFGLSSTTSVTPRTDLQVELISAWAKQAGDLDDAVLTWLRDGAPLGIARHLDVNGVFPEVTTPGHEDEFDFLHTDWTNYSGVDQNEQAYDMMQALETRGYLRRFRSLDETTSFVGGPPVISKLALLQKTVRLPSGAEKVKQRLIMDCRHSGVNSLALHNQRIILPTPRDVVHDVLSLHAVATNQGQPTELEWLVIDIQEAFFQMPLHPDEFKYAVARLLDPQGEEVFFVFTRLPMGGKNSPQCWGRAAALFGRLMAGLLPGTSARLQLYVDDPLCTFVGDRVSRNLHLASLVLALTALGIKLSWQKGARSTTTITWIGASFSLREHFLDVSAKPELLLDLGRLIADALSRNTIKVKSLRTLVGKANHLAGIVPLVRPFLAPLWAALHKPGGPLQSIWTKQIRHALLWLQALLTRNGGQLVRSFPLDSFTRQLRHIVTDVDGSPWGLGATLSENGVVVKLMASPLTKDDFTIHGFKPGDCRGQQTWECLCVLVMIRLWSDLLLRPGVHWTIRTDNTTVLNLITKLSASGEGPSLIAKEIALELSDMAWQPKVASHIPGIDNTIPDILSRLAEP